MRIAMMISDSLHPSDKQKETIGYQYPSGTGYASENSSAAFSANTNSSDSTRRFESLHHPRHSDFTVPTSNQRSCYSPPLNAGDDFTEQQQAERRNIFGSAVNRKYRLVEQPQQLATTAALYGAIWNNALDAECDYYCEGPRHHYHPVDTSQLLLSRDPGQDELLDDTSPFHSRGCKNHQISKSSTGLNPTTVPLYKIDGNNSPLRNFSDLTVEEHPPQTHWNDNLVDYQMQLQQQHYQSNDISLLSLDDEDEVDEKMKKKSTQRRPHETIHAQSLLLGLAFAAVWSPSNLMAPNLTRMADTFGLTDAAMRDLYLGSYCALATGVLSFPIAALLGIWTDFVSRQRLFVLTVAGGGMTACLTGICTKYWQLFLARLINGGFMSGSVPVAFSFLGDLFATEERNAASSGLTAMMGAGIICGQVYAGMVGSSQGWPHAFFVSGMVTLVLALMCLCFVQEPVRGGKEKALQDMLKAGSRYERTLTWEGFLHAMQHNKSNGILLWQGFFSSLPWGIIFVFLNDYLSQERGFSVPDATYLVFLFGVGSAAGGILGGYWGHVVQARDRSYLPLFMAASTALGILPFLGLLNTRFANAHEPLCLFYTIMAGLVASLPSVNVRPCLINVNPPETRGASLTAANLLISLGRGLGPSCVTLMVTTWHVDRQFAFNVTLCVFWLISAMQLLFLSRTLPVDQDKMEAELASYAMAALENQYMKTDESVVTIEERITSFDGVAARETLQYMRDAIVELRAKSNSLLPCNCDELESSGSEDEMVAPGDDNRWNANLPGSERPDDLSLTEQHVEPHARLADEATPLVV